MISPITTTPPIPQDITQKQIEEQIDEQKNLLIQNTTHFLTIQYLFEESSWYKSPGYGFTPKYLWKRENQDLLEKVNGQTATSNYALYTQMLKKAQTLAKNELNEVDTTLMSEKEKKEHLSKLSELTGEKLKVLFLETIHQINEKRIEKLRTEIINDPNRSIRSFFSFCLIETKIIFIKANHTRQECIAELIYYIFNRVIQFNVKSLISTHIKMFDDYSNKMNLDKYCSFKNDVINNLSRCLTSLNAAYTEITTETTRKAGTGTLLDRVTEELCKESYNQRMTAETLYQEFAKTLIISTLGQLKGSLASRALQWFIKPGEIVGSLVQAIAGSSKDNQGYSHVVKTLLLEQLNKFEELLKNPKPSPGSRPISENKQQELAGVISQLIELLDKSQCQTVDQLTRVVNNTGFPLTVLSRHLETLFMSQWMNSLALLISDLIDSHSNPLKIYSLILKLFTVTNEAFLPPVKVLTEAEMQKTEKQVNEATKRIIDLSINGVTNDLISQNINDLINQGINGLAQGINILINKSAKHSEAEATINSESLSDPSAQPPQVNFKTPLLQTLQNGTPSSWMFIRMVQKIKILYSMFRACSEPISTLGTVWEDKEALMQIAKPIGHKVTNQALDTAVTALPFLRDTVVPLLRDTVVPFLCDAATKTPRIHSTAIERVNALYKIITERNVYLCALHHLVLIPYVEAMKRKKH